MRNKFRVIHERGPGQMEDSISACAEVGWTLIGPVQIAVSAGIVHYVATMERHGPIGHDVGERSSNQPTTKEES